MSEHPTTPAATPSMWPVASGQRTVVSGQRKRGRGGSGGGAGGDDVVVVVGVRF